MRKTFVIVSVSERWENLNALVKNIRSFRKFDDFDICCCFQDWQGTRGKLDCGDQFAVLLVEPERMGCSGARIHLLKHLAYDVYVNLDDDMTLLDLTDYSAAITKAMEKDTGFVLTNWRKSEKLIEAARPKMANTFVKQILIYQGGGMVYGEKIAKLIRQLPVEKTMFDDVWPMTAYVNGYVNFRFLGSLALHYICSTGGMRSFMRETNPKHSTTGLIDYKPGKRPGEFLIPLDKDILPLAHEMHARNREKRRARGPIMGIKL